MKTEFQNLNELLNAFPTCIVCRENWSATLEMVYENIWSDQYYLAYDYVIVDNILSLYTKETIYESFSKKSNHFATYHIDIYSGKYTIEWFDLKSNFHGLYGAAKWTCSSCQTWMHTESFKLESEGGTLRDISLEGADYYLSSGTDQYIVECQYIRKEMWIENLSQPIPIDNTGRTRNHIVQLPLYNIDLSDTDKAVRHIRTILTFS